MPHPWPSRWSYLGQGYQWHSLWNGKDANSFSLFLVINLSKHYCCKTLSQPMLLTSYHHSPLDFPCCLFASYSYHFRPLLSAISVLCCIFFRDKLSWFHSMVFVLMSSKHVLSPSTPLASNSVYHCLMPLDQSILSLTYSKSKSKCLKLNSSFHIHLLLFCPLSIPFLFLQTAYFYVSSFNLFVSQHSFQ